MFMVELLTKRMLTVKVEIEKKEKSKKKEERERNRVMRYFAE